MTKVLLSFGILALLIATLGYFSLANLGEGRDSTHDVVAHATMLHHLQQASEESFKISQSVREVILSADDPAKVKQQIDAIRQSDIRFRSEFGAFRDALIYEENKRRAAEIEQQYNEMRQEQDRVVALVREGKVAEAKAGLTRLRPMLSDLDGRMQEMVKVKAEVVEKHRTMADTNFASARVTVLLGVALVIALALAIGFWLARTTDKQMMQNADYAGQLAAIHKAQAVIEFKLDGTIVSANENFLTTLGYRLEEIQGRHHSMFVVPAEAASHEYREFWAKLNRGEFVAAEFKRIGKGGKEVWIQASYNPILDLNGKPYKVVKFATDITAAKLTNTDYAGQLAAIHKAQAVIEFKLDGTIVSANENFLTTLGYRLEEIQGRHHSMFVVPAEAASHEYREFWAKLNRGEFVAAEFKRIGKGGKEVWIQASYNPILDLNGKPYKVVKFATDITAAKLTNTDYAGQLAAIHKAQAVIEFKLDGTIVSANENFLTTLGYRLEEIQGRHHSMFVVPAEAASHEYREFWAKLNRGEFVAAEFKRIGKGGKEVWIQASYNPILDLNGKPYKVVKFATDITAAKLTNTDYAGQLAAIHKAQAVIEFKLDGTIVSANENF